MSNFNFNVRLDETFVDSNRNDADYNFEIVTTYTDSSDYNV